MLNWKSIPEAGLLALALAGVAHAQTSIEVERLDTLDPWQVGLPSAGLRGNVWSASEADMLGLVLEALPDASSQSYDSPAVAALGVAILSTGGQPPQGGRGDASLAVQRVDRLVAVGGVPRGYDLLERTPGLGQAPALARWHAELAFLSGDDARACQTANALLSGRDQPYWLRTRAYCLLLDGNIPAAELTAELARGQDANEGFEARLHALSLEAGLAENAPGVETGLEWAMSRRIQAVTGNGGAWPDLADTAPAWLRDFKDRVARPRVEPAADPVQHLAAAETQVGPSRLAHHESVLAQGLDRELSAEALGRIFADAGWGQPFIRAAQRYGREIASLPVTERTIEHGYPIALAAILVGDLRTARAWRDALVDGPPRPAPVPLTLPGDKPGDLSPALQMQPMPDPVEWEPPSPRRMVILDLALAVASDDLEGGSFEALLAAWLEMHGEAGLAETLALTRLGAPDVEGLRAALFAAPAIAAPGAAAMDAAARAGARGEAALIALDLLATPATAGDADSVARAVATLDAVGLRQHALAILLERIVARAG
ncbi:hypothetical protein [Maricaulis sp. CAU 1757]